MAGVPEEALAAVERLKGLIVPGTGGVDAPEQIGLVDLAASPISDAAMREKLAEMLIGALTVLRFGPLLGGDLEAAREVISSLTNQLAVADQAADQVCLSRV